MNYITFAGASGTAPVDSLQISQVSQESSMNQDRQEKYVPICKCKLGTLPWIRLDSMHQM